MRAAAVLLALLSCAPVGSDSALPTRAPGFSRDDGGNLHATASLGAMTLGPDGLTLRGLGAGAPRLSVRTTALGRETLTPLPPGAPTLGRCAPTCEATLQRPGLEERWALRGAHLSQSWTLMEPPVGEGALRLRVELEGASEVQGSGSQLQVVDAAGDPVRIWGLAAWDADGVDLPIVAQAEGAGFVLTVDDAGARYPIEIDPLYGSATWHVLGSDGDYGRFAEEIGDVNGDGYGDMAISSFSKGYSIGRVHIYLGSATGFSASPEQSLQGSAFGAYFGIAMAGGGDVNGDGYDDLLVSSHVGSTASEAKVELFLGSATGLSTTASATLTGASASDYFGGAVDIIGDVNADGYADVVVGAYKGSSNKGVAYVYHGSASGLSTTAARSYTGTSSVEYLGATVSTAGDVNGDGYDDLLVGALGTDTVRLYLGSSSGLGSSATSTFTQSGMTTFGNTLQGGGDVNADGYDDILIADSNGSTNGKVFLYLGASGGPSTTATASWVGASASSTFGYVMDIADYNDDGYDDIAIGAPNGSSGAGEVGIYNGSASGAAATRSATLTGATGSSLGMALVGRTDFNGDGIADLMATASSYGFGPEGLAAVYLGSLSSGLVAFQTLSNPDPYFSGIRTWRLGDVNGDGVPDFGLSSAHSSSSQYGWVYVYHGSADTISTTPSTTLSSSTYASPTMFGYSVDGVGDVNGDGYDDLVVGAYAHNSYKGAVYVYHGSATGLSSTAAATFYGGTGGYLGYAVVGLGDVNGDGYADVGGGTNAGTTEPVTVYYGSSSGLSTGSTTTLSHGTASVSYGVELVGGDVNGDGYADIAVGAPKYSTSTGDVKVYLGSAAGISTTATATLVGETTNSDFGTLLELADLNGDGYDDLVVGAPGYDSDTGRLYVYYSAGAAGLSTSAGTVITGSLSAISGFSTLDAVGDLSGDGYEDLAVGLPDSGVGGQVVLYEGSASGLSTTVSTTLTETGVVEALSFGTSLAGVGDVNDDGFDDVLVAGSYEAGLFLGYDTDSDGDGSADSADCAPANADIHPGATEACDGVDNDCDGVTDEEAPTWYPDLDGDSFGDGASGVAACAAPSGYLANSLDCDDADAAIFPGAGEVCDGDDNDCDGLVDEAGATGLRTFYLDADGDGYGVSGSTTSSCTVPSGYSATHDDCDDADASENPGASERCDGDDDDCDGVTDEASATDALTFYRDADGDSFGDASATTAACAVPSGYVADATDCNDSAAAVSPAASESCNGADDNCDGVTDEATAVDAPTWYTDTDGDGYGDSTLTTVACTAPSGAVATGGDCNEASVAVNPGSSERCNSVDDDCDGSTDEDSAIDAVTWYVDGDGDGYGAVTATARACAAPTGYVASSDDCDDADASHSPGSAESCNGADDDCDGSVDEGPPADAPAWYVDADGDGHGDPATATQACLAIGGTVALGDDCDDGDLSVSPSAAETCDGRDEDCDGVEDDGLPTSRVYDDADGDGYGDPDTEHEVCAIGADEVEEAGDCDDGDADVSPGEDERWYDGIDQDCAGGDDWDADGDGQQAASAGGGDCNDADATVYTGAEDPPYDGKNSDCGTFDDFDADHDGHTAAEYGGDDCDDADPTVVDCAGGEEGGADGIAEEEGAGGGGKSGCAAVGGAPASAFLGLLGLLALRRRSR